MNGIFGVIKPRGITSADVLRQIRRKIGKVKIGHAGTLDPLASGVLVIALGDSTKKLSLEGVKEKEYVADIILGATSATDDAEGEKTFIECRKPSAGDVEKEVKNFVGRINQTPPVYSAVKVKGREAYKYARAGLEIKLPARSVLIAEIEILQYEFPDLKLRVVTGPGVYIRALARDLGEKLGCGGYLSDLVRTRVGDFTLQNSADLQEFLNNRSHLEGSARL